MTQTEHETFDSEAPNSSLSIGSFLKREREKKGLTYVQVSDLTRLRPHFLKALELEDWDQLPSPVFVRGFIRSYARALGLNEGELLEHYVDSIPSDSAPPKPLMGPPRRARKSLVLPLCAILVILTGYLIWLRPWADRFESAPTAELSGSKLPSETGDFSKTEPPPETPSADTLSEEIGKEPAVQPEAAVPVAQESRPEASEVEKPSLQEVEPIAPSENQAAAAASAARFSLKADVHGKTWVKISVDDQPPKEYIFNAGSHPQWTAQDHFELVIGNAGGIRLQLNDSQIGTLGEQGQVVHLNLPAQLDQYTEED